MPDVVRSGADIRRLYAAIARLLGSLILLLALPAHALDSQSDLRDLRIARWGVDDGLPQIAVLALAQDHDGYLWIGTQNGVASFDGVRFISYNRNNSGVDTTLAGSALIDSTNRVWFGTPRGAICIENGKARSLTRAGEAIGVVDLVERSDGHILFATENGLYVDDGDRLVEVPGERAPVQSLLADGAHLWVGGVGTVHDHANPGLAALRLLPNQRINVIRRHGDELWLGSDTGVLRIDPVSGEMRSVDPALRGFSVSALLWDRNDNLWIGSNDALLRYRPDGRIDRTDGKELGVQLWVHSIVEGREGQLWVGTHRDSLLRLGDSTGTLINDGDGLADSFVWSLLDDNAGGMLIGTNSGLERRNADGSLERVIDASRLPDPAIYTLAHADDGAFWLGTRHGLALWRNGRVDVPASLDPLRPFQINAVLRNGPDDYWIASLDGLYRYRGGRLEHLDAEPGSSVARVRTLLTLGDDDLLIGTEAGLRRVREGRIERLPWAAELEQSFVTKLTWIGPERLAIGTMDRGLGLIDLRRNGDGHIDPATVGAAGPLLLADIDQGLSSHNIWSLDIIGDYLYAGTVQGVYRVAVANLPDPAAPASAPIEIQYVYAAPGRNARSLQRLACCNGGGDARSLIDGDTIWYATTDGAARIDTLNIQSRPAPPMPRVESISNSNQRYRPGQPLVLSGEHRDVAIEYTGLSLIDSDMIQFRYRLIGYDPDWQFANTRRVAYYTHLSPGDYQFVMQARHPTGSWSADSVPLDLHIAPHWYERSLVHMLAAALLSLLFAGLIVQHGRRGRAREVQLERAVADRTAALQRAIGHLRDANAALAEESRTDALTGLSNRRLDLSRGLDDGTLALLDIDHFKQVNDQHGHTSGDRVLVELAGLLKASVGDDDQVARWGGEEFLLFLAGRSMADAMRIAETIRRTVATHSFRMSNGEAVALTCSIGLAKHPRDSAWHATVELADAALYQAKREGRNCCIGTQLTLSPEPADSQQPLTTRLPALLESGELRWLRSVQDTRQSTPQSTWPGLMS